ncbi:MAG TPA: flagellar basal body P-ring formation chaperone FlgA, partial [Deltaproteobacteria bacterium]|nr:flagellar basal body P-ring formation chaperone FlgA [Deltaproteobacteria bacterium]
AILLLVLCCALSGTAAAGGGNRVELKAEAACTGKSLLLGCIAEVSGPDADVLSRIPVASLPGGSKSVYVTGAAIEARVRARFLGHVVFSGADRVRVAPCTVEVSGEALKKAFVEEVLAHSPWKDTGSMEVTEVRVSRLPRLLPADSLPVRAKFARREDFLGFINATLLVGPDPSPEKVTVTARIRLMVEAPLVRAKIGAGRIIEPGDLVMRTIDLSRFPDAYVRPEDCVGKRARVTLREGKPILTGQVERKPDVCSGDTVIIRAGDRNIAVEVKGVAEKDGYRGEKIPVKNASSGRQLIGTIIAPSVVQVQL